MAIVPETLVQLLLYVCFGVYLFMGLVLMGMGIWYWSDAGAVGATAVYLLLVGLLMLIVGGIALFANFKKMWLILFIIELFNVALFLFLYIVIVVVLMMASGSSDPVTKTTKASWDTILPDLTIAGSDGEGDIYCKTATGGTTCDLFFSTTGGPATAANGCDVTVDELGDVLANCSSIKTSDASLADKLANGYEDTDRQTNCNAFASTCDACSMACMEASIQKVKDQMLPASYFTFFLCFYLFIVVCFNQIAVGSEDLEGPVKIVGLVLNGAVILFSFVAFIIAIIGLVDANDACPQHKDDCVPDSLLFMIFFGFCLLVLGGIATAGIQLNQNMLIRIANLVMIFFSLLLLLAALLMGISSGAVMDDMGYYYDTNYPKLRDSLEKLDNSYCRLSEDDCTTLTYDKAGTAGVYPKNCPEGEACTDIIIDEDSPYWDGTAYQMTADAIWLDQYSVLAAKAKADPSNSHLEPCAATGICIYCKTFYDAVEIGVPAYTANAPPAESDCMEQAVVEQLRAGRSRAQADMYSVTADKTACDAAADAAACTANDKCTYLSSAGDCFETAATSVEADAAACAAIMTDAQLADDTACLAVKTAATAQLAADQQVSACTYQDRDAYKAAPNLNFGQALAGNQYDSLVKVAATADAPETLNFYSEAFTYSDTTGFDTSNKCVAAADGGDATPCTAAQDAFTQDNAADAAACTAAGGGGACTFQQAPMTPAEWTSIISNFTTYNEESRFAMPDCEGAVQDYAKDTTTCNLEAIEAKAAGDKTYADDCAACDSALTPFAFNFDRAMSDGNQQRCLNFFVGHMKKDCGSGLFECKDMVRPATGVAGKCEGAPTVFTEAECTAASGTFSPVPADSAITTQIDPIIKEAIEGKNKFCGYTDTACKIKIQDTIESSMTVIGVFGAIFLGFFVVIIFLTEQGIVIYRGGDDDDDGDDDGDDDDDDESDE